MTENHPQSLGNRGSVRRANTILYCCAWQATVDFYRVHSAGQPYENRGLINGL